MNQLQEYLDLMCRKMAQVDVTDMELAAELMQLAHSRGSKVIFVGNGGSAGIASHIAVDLTKNTGIRAINFNEADLLTCLANDYGYEHWVEKAIEFYADPRDVAVLISSSGQSPNILNGARAARERGVQVITLSGFEIDNPLRSLGDINFWVDSGVYNVVETVHQAWLAAIIDSMSETGEFLNIANHFHQ